LLKDRGNRLQGTLNPGPFPKGDGASYGPFER
jgi:hypothetical protein